LGGWNAVYKYISQDILDFDQSTPCVKKQATIKLLCTSSPNIDRFSKSFHWHTLACCINNKNSNAWLSETRISFLVARWRPTQAASYRVCRRHAAAVDAAV